MSNAKTMEDIRDGASSDAEEWAERLAEKHLGMIRDAVAEWAKNQRGSSDSSEVLCPPAVSQLAQRHADKWQDKDDDYWMRRLNQEVSELQLVLDGQHEDPAELELAEIASICINWLKKRQAA